MYSSGVLPRTDVATSGGFILQLNCMAREAAGAAALLDRRASLLFQPKELASQGRKHPAGTECEGRRRRSGEVFRSIQRYGNEVFSGVSGSSAVRK